MNDKKLSVNRKSAINFSQIESITNRVSNLFVITHLGQLKQMEALIQEKKLSNNLLVVLFTTKNIIVPQTVHDKYSDFFEAAIFLEIPFKANVYDYFIYKKIEKEYFKLITSILPLNLYLNSFESHYSLLASITKFFGIRTILVEEGTATYKDICRREQPTMNLEKYSSKFIKTVGKTQQFKKLVRYKKDFNKKIQNPISFYLHNYIFDKNIRRNTKELYSETRNFFKAVVRDEYIHIQIINKLGSRHLKSSLEPFKAFDKAFVSHPELIKRYFEIEDVEFFLAHSFHDSETVKYAKGVIENYDITSYDVLFVSQRYFLDPDIYLQFFKDVVLSLVDSNQKLFIKLHPKEGDLTFDLFANYAKSTEGKVILIEDNKFLIETVIKLVKFNSVIGITSTTLIYTPLISPETRVIAIADSLIRLLENRSNLDCEKHLDNIKEHLKIIRVFNNITFI